MGALLLAPIAGAAAHAGPVARGASSEGAPDLYEPRVARLTYVTASARSSPRVWLASVGGSEAKLLGPGVQPLLAPDGRSVAAALFGASVGSDEHGPAIAIYSAAGARPPVATYLSLETATATPLAWSPDSRYLAVQRESTATTNIAAGSGLDVIDTQTGKVVSIAAGEINGASFARDGSDRVVFALAHSLSDSASVNLYLSNPDGTGRSRLTSDGRSLNPVWGPRYIAYDRERLRRYAPAYQIWLAAPSGERIRRVTDVPAGPLVAGLVPLAFSADGSRLLAEFEGQDTSDAWAVSVSSGRARMLSVHGRSVEGAGISSDGRTLLIDEGALGEPPSNDRIASVPFAGGHARVLIPHGSEASWNG